MEKDPNEILSSIYLLIKTAFIEDLFFKTGICVGDVNMVGMLLVD